MAINDQYTNLENVDVRFDLKVSGTFTPSGDISFADGKQVRPDGATATASAGAATLSKQSGVITSEALTTAGLAAYTLTLTNTLVAATSIVLVGITNGTNSAGSPDIGLVTPGAGSATIQVVNRHTAVAFNGTVVISFLVLNPQ